MRVINSIKNTIFSIIANIVTIFIGMISQSVIIKTLGVEYTGINGLFNNILSILAIAELGIGTAIVFSLYKPVAENDIEKINSLMNFYKVSYRIIATIIFITGIMILPFLSYIVGETVISENINLIYILFLIDTIVSYLLAYKRSILYATQKIYITKIVHIGYLLVMNVSQIIALYLTQNYIIFLVIKIFCRILENIVITLITNKIYPYIKNKKAKKLDMQTKKSILNKVKGLIFHKMGGFIVQGTDNIIISTFINIRMVGFYSNYNLIISAVSTLFQQIFESLTPSIGNLLIEENKDKTYSIFKNMTVINSWLYCFAMCGISFLIEPFISIWIGKEFILPYDVLIVLMINFYIQGMRQTYNSFKNAAGIFYEDRFIPLLEATVNIFASIVFLKLFGLAGVFMGTIASNLTLFIFSYPKYVYKKILEKTYSKYIKDNIKFLIITIIATIITLLIIHMINVNNLIVQLILRSIIVLIIPNMIYFIIYFRTDEFKYILDTAKLFIDKIKYKKYTDK